MTWPNDRVIRSNVSQRDTYRTFGDRSPPERRVARGICGLTPALGVTISRHRGSGSAGGAFGGLAGGYGSLTGCPAAMACVLRRPLGVFPSSPRRRGRSGTTAGHLWDGSAALVPAWQGATRGIGLTPVVVVASCEAAHLVKVERQIADQVAALRPS